MRRLLFIIIITTLSFSIFGCKEQETANNSYEDIRLVSEYSSSTSVDEMDSILFGSYRQGNNNDIEAIEWLALDYDKVNNRVLLLSKDIIDSRCYQDISEDEFDDMFYSDNPIKLTWENCSLRKWLNNEFYNTAFNDNEKQRILVMNIANNDNIDTGAKSGVNTYDKVFLLSIDEMRKYFGSGVKYEYGYELNKKAATRGTDFAKIPKFLKTGMKELYVSDDVKWYGGNSGYWLRTIGTSYGHATIVTSDGNMKTNGDLVCACYGVRPAMWVYTGEVENITDVKEDNKETINDTYLMEESERNEEKQESEYDHNENKKEIDNEVIKDGKQKDDGVTEEKIPKKVREPKMLIEMAKEEDYPAGFLTMVLENINKGYILNDIPEERKRLSDYLNSVKQYEDKAGLNYENTDNTINSLGYLSLAFHPYDGKGNIKERLKVDFPEFKDDDEVLNFMAKVYEMDEPNNAKAYVDKYCRIATAPPEIREIFKRIAYDNDKNTGIKSVNLMQDEKTGKLFWTKDKELFDKWYRKAVYNGVMYGVEGMDLPEYTLAYFNYNGGNFGGYIDLYLDEKDRRIAEEAKCFAVPLPSNEVQYYNESEMCPGSALKYINALNPNGAADYSLKGGVVACDNSTYIRMNGDYPIIGLLSTNARSIYQMAEAECFRLNNPGIKIINRDDYRQYFRDSYIFGMPKYTYQIYTMSAYTHKNPVITGYEIAWIERINDYPACDSTGKIQYAIAGPSRDLKKTRGHSNYFGGWSDYISAERRDIIIGDETHIDYDIYWFEAVGWTYPGTTLYVPY